MIKLFLLLMLAVNQPALKQRKPTERPKPQQQSHWYIDAATNNWMKCRGRQRAIIKVVPKIPWERMDIPRDGVVETMREVIWVADECSPYNETREVRHD